ncbi:uroporphyrinogen-III synthase [Mycetocola tolaasinivorans]|uniref:Uroporphyrinogen-III synthase n=1 Tax=Mycetocola tolaasinivorans TaxID=76635 RepID=A0A3L6ZZ27_9MICO|nr:uroporphyrinogen-III synthase [Mycetocola tolaasinivorans]RLP72691.1 uroporphyrinogen-III synthase [Mycetocola tolaasinivorans]
MSTTGSSSKPLTGWRILVPRGGPWGDGVAAELRRRGATPVIAPMVNFAPTDNPEALAGALESLQAGAFDWVTLTSATTVDVLYAHRVRVPAHTKIAAVGETTAAAAQAAGFVVTLVPAEDNSAAGMVQELVAREPEPRHFLTLRAANADPVLTRGLIAAGHNVESVMAYRTVGEPVAEKVIADVHSGRINALLVTSGSIADQVAAQFGELPSSTLVAAIGPRTANDAAAAGLRVDLIADEQTVAALLDAVVTAAESGHAG